MTGDIESDLASWIDDAGRSDPVEVLNALLQRKAGLSSGVIGLEHAEPGNGTIYLIYCFPVAKLLRVRGMTPEKITVMEDLLCHKQPKGRAVTRTVGPDGDSFVVRVKMHMPIRHRGQFEPSWTEMSDMVVSEAKNRGLLPS